MGDKVFIRVDLKNNLAPTRICTQTMYKFIKDCKPKTVSYVGDNFVYISEDEGNWHWDFGWLFPVDDDFEGNI